MNHEEMPTGFGMALMQDTAAAEHFAALDACAQHELLQRARQADSKQEMQALIRQIGGDARG